MKTTWSVLGSFHSLKESSVHNKKIRDAHAKYIIKDVMPMHYSISRLHSNSSKSGQLCKKNNFVLIFKATNSIIWWYIGNPSVHDPPWLLLCGFLEISTNFKSLDIQYRNNLLKEDVCLCAYININVLLL